MRTYAEVIGPRIANDTRHTWRSKEAQRDVVITSDYLAPYAEFRERYDNGKQKLIASGQEPQKGIEIVKLLGPTSTTRTPSKKRLPGSIMDKMLPPSLRSQPPQ
jgi:hypothetical protein